LLSLQTAGAQSAYPTVTEELLLHPDAGDWLMYRRTYDGAGSVPKAGTLLVFKLR
jgi:hypothetical protein